MWAVPIYVGKIFTKTITEPCNKVQEVTAAIQAEHVFIVLGIIAIAVAFLLRFSSGKHPELRLDDRAS
jgi:hypothetical protein